MKRVKRAVAMVLAGVMLCGIAVTANAAEHTHVYGNWGAWVCYNSFSSGTHTYVKSDGTTGTCTLLVNQYKRVGTCSCGATDTDYRTEMIHTSCGQ